MTWEPKQAKWQWRRYLTAKEKKTLERADAAKAKWLALNSERAAITNRAIQRAKYADRCLQKRGNAYCRMVFAENVKYGGMP